MRQVINFLTAWLNYQPFLIIAVLLFSIQSCKKQDLPVTSEASSYQIEKISATTFNAMGWKVQQVNIVSGTTIFADQSNSVNIVCAPENNSNPWLAQGAVTMNLPTSTDTTLRRVRLRRGGYSGTMLSDLTELKYSTYVVQNAPTIIVLQIDINNDNAKDFNIYFDPREDVQSFQFITWQQWDPLHGKWHAEVPTIPLPQFMSGVFTLRQLLDSFPTARIIDTPPIGHNGEGVRFTIGGNPRSAYDNTIGYFDALIIGTRNQSKSTLYDFTCN